MPVTTTTSTTSTTAPGTSGSTSSALHRPVKIQRNWIALDFASLPKRDSNKTAGSYAISPLVIEGLAFGTLTGSIRSRGTETIDGVKTTHYAGDVTLAELKASFKDADKSVREQREKSTEQLEKLGLDKFTMDMWVDGENHAKQFRMRGDADKGKFDMTFTFLDYNKPVTVEAPPAKDTADLAEMMKELQNS